MLPPLRDQEVDRDSAGVRESPSLKGRIAALIHIRLESGRSKSLGDQVVSVPIEHPHGEA
jgi:hypothetical protein